MPNSRDQEMPTLGKPKMLPYYEALCGVFGAILSFLNSSTLGLQKITPKTPLMQVGFRPCWNQVDQITQRSNRCRKHSFNWIYKMNDRVRD